ncbi:MAG: YbaY family lipoprotein [Mizugakiibacter sp.]|uniref:YbaY family lipoprotein n=1 Tax=Mizugakiibacter sp. TaxID=1972610 RepID=UPI0031BD358A|nr:YbaY family lipoprotein [Xanthomonadaceae bacterium]
MRTIAMPLLAATLFVAGCSGSQSPDQAASGAGQAAITAVTGTVSLRDADAKVSPQARLDLSLVDVSQQPVRTVASKTVDPVGQLPQSFSLDFKPADIVATDLYVLHAEMVDGERHYTTPLQYPVLTKGAPAQVAVKMVAEATPAEKLMDSYKQVKNRIGGMKIEQGTALGESASRGWQVFREKGEVAFIRERVDYFDKGATSTDIAYQDGKPWVVIQQKMAHQGEKPSTIDRAGWDEQGNLVLKERVEGGKTGPLPDDAAKALYDDAAAILAKVGKK